MDRGQILDWLREEDPVALETLWRAADEVRRHHVGDAVHLRGLIELSNICVRQCSYCGIRAGNDLIERYRMTDEEVMGCVAHAVEYGYGTVVLQTGEDYGLTGERIANLVRRIKAETPLAVTLSLGERSTEDLALWRQAGADRYLLRFETSDPVLFAHIHPPLPGRSEDRLAMLGHLRELGYEIGSGVMVGIPGQSYDSLANDIMLFHRMNLDMIGVGPFIPHPATPLGKPIEGWRDGGMEGMSQKPHTGDGAANPPLPCAFTREGVGGREFKQVPATDAMTLKAVALTRLVCPEANIPSTTALATINQVDGRELGLQRGANIVMPNLTPLRYRKMYEIYPDKACVGETAEQCSHCLAGRILSIGRTIGTGRGGRKR